MKASFDPPRGFLRALSLFAVVLTRLSVLLPPAASAQGTNCVPCPSGLIDWWPGDGSTTNLAGTGSGTLQNGASFAAGQVGQAFRFDGVNDHVAVPDSARWAFGTNDFSIQLWANFAAASDRHTFLASDSGGGTQNKWIFWLDYWKLIFHLNGSSGYADIGVIPFSPTLDRWYHIAVTRSGSTYTFFTNGAVAGVRLDNRSVPDANALLTIGQAEGSFRFSGMLDEVAIFNRALSSDEVAALYGAGTNGICMISAPVITQQPASQTVATGDDVVLNVDVGGDAPFEYQWRKGGADLANGGRISGARTATLTITHAESGDAGNYSVVVTNNIGSVSSSNAALVVMDVFPHSGPVLWESFGQQTWAQGPQRAIPDGAGGIFVYFQPLNMVGGQPAALPIRLRESDGQWDSSFQPACSFDQVGAVAVQGDGRIVIAGRRNGADIIIRCLPDGTLDDSFFAPCFNRGTRFITVLPDGKLLLALTDNFSVNPPRNAILVTSPTLYRLNPDGGIDPTFHRPALGGGTTLIYAPPVVDSARRIYLGGTFWWVDGVSRINFARLHPDGTLDTTYAASTSIAGGMKSTQLRGIGLQSDGKAVVVGDFLVPSNAPSANRLAALRFDTDGNYDTTFAQVKVSEIRAGYLSTRPRHLVMLPDDKFVAVIDQLVRFNADGSIDFSFHRAVFLNEAYWVARLADGRLVVPGVLSADGQPVGGVAMFSTNGNLVQTWEAPGFGNRIGVNSHAITSDGRVAVAGAFNRAGSATNVAFSILSLTNGEPAVTQINLATLHPEEPTTATDWMAPSAPLLANGPADTLCYHAYLATTNEDYLFNGTFRSCFGKIAVSDGQPDPGFMTGPSASFREKGLTDMFGVGDRGHILLALTAQAAVDDDFGMPVGTNGQENFSIPRPAWIDLLVKVTRDFSNNLQSIQIGALDLGPISANGNRVALLYDINGYARVMKLGADLAQLPSFNSPLVPNPGENEYEVYVNDPAGGDNLSPLCTFRTGHVLRDACELSDGKVLVVGSYPGIGLVRLNTDGSEDTSLPQLALKYQDDFADVEPDLKGVAADSAGRIYVAGRFNKINGVRLAGLARLLPDGSVDATFCPDLRHVPVPDERTELLVLGSKLVVFGPFCRPHELLPPAYTIIDINSGSGNGVVSPQPLGGLLAPGQEMTLQAGVSGLTSPVYQWFKSGVQIVGATNSSLVLGPAKRADAGDYWVKTVGNEGAIVSQVATVEVTMPAQLLTPAIDGGFLRLAFGDSDGSPLPACTRPRFEVQSSVDLANWTALPATLVLEQDRFATEVPLSTGMNRFYRVVER